MIGRRSRAAFAALAIASSLAVAPRLDAQTRTRLYADVEKRYEVRVPKWLKAVPAKPGDQQTLAKFIGTKKSTKKPYRGELEMTLLVIRIPRRSGAVTGTKEEKGDGAEPDKQSLAEERVALLNSSRNLDQFLRARRFRSPLEENPELFKKKPPRDHHDRPYQVHELPARRGGASIRAFVVESDSEIFGIVAIGVGLNPFHREIVRVVKSLRDEVRRPEEAEEDPYIDSELRDIDRRRQVREELVRGWTAHDSENFILVTNTKSMKLIKRMLVDLEIMRVAYFERFPPAENANMDAVSTVRVCHGYDDYLKYAGKGLYGTGGYWNFREEELVLFNPEKKVPREMRWVKKVDPSAVLYHEAMHQYFHYSNRSSAPGSWFNEGYGEFFGASKLDRTKGVVKSIGKNKSRMALIKLAKKKKEPPPELSRMLRYTQAQFYRLKPLHNYAYSWSFCYFLEKEAEKSDRRRNDAWAQLPNRYVVELRKATAAARAKMPEDAPDDWIAKQQNEIQKVAIEATLEGIDMTELQKAWEKFVRRL